MEATAEEVQVTKYPSYKDSGVEWLGEIPAHWECIKAKHLWREKIELSQTGEETLLSVSQYLGVNNRENDSRSESLTGYKIVAENDLVINIMLAWLGGLGLSPLNGVVSPAYGVYELLSEADPKFLHYLYRTDTYLDEFARRSRGVVPSRWRMYTDDFGQVLTVFPPQEEQSAIARFLDRKTAQIDKAIDIKEKQIALLKERRQILIHNAVTLGLNPDAPMKDSGVEWIGEIPAHWNIVKLKLISEFVYDGTHGSYPRVDIGYRLLSVRNIIEDKFVFRDDDSHVSERHFKEISSKFLVKKGDIQLAIVGATLGKVAIVEQFDDHFVTQRSVCTIRVKEEQCSNNFLFFFIKSNPFQSYLWLNAGFSAQPGVYLGTVQNSSIPLPSIEEQNDIASHLKSISNKFGVAIDCKEKEIEKLKEYKTSLIHSAVTGKIKVC